MDSTTIDTDIVDEISFSVATGETLGIVGESGSGKTTLAMALLGVTRSGCRIAEGSVRIADTEILGVAERKRRALRARLISYVPQDPSTALSPAMRVGRQITETVRAHHPDGEVHGRVRTALESAQLPTDDTFLRRYPHQLSGGQQQRVSIAIALVSQPTVIVLDEPTTGLDVTTQARLLEEIKTLSSSSDVAFVYVSHDLAVIRNLADRVAVMYGGRIVEVAPVDELFRNPGHPYTRRLLEAIPRVDTAGWRPRGIPGSAVEPWNRPPGCPYAPRCEFRVATCDTTMPPTELDGDRTIRCWRRHDVLDSVSDQDSPGRSASPERPTDAVHEAHESLLTIRSLDAGYGRRRFRIAFRRPPVLLAVHDVSLQVGHGSCVGLVGESGSGKTTLMRCIAGLHVPDSGEMRLRGDALAYGARRRDADLRRQIQLVPQNPDSSLNPRQSVAQIVGRPLRQFFGLDRRERQQRVLELLERVRLRGTMATRLPRELSGGEKQRIAIARALAAEPELLLCDEITSALDVAVQAGILDLLADLRNETGMAIVFVSHDLAVVRAIADDVVVMRHGRVRESNSTDRIFGTPEDEYTRELLAAVPRLRDGDYPRLVPNVAGAG